MIIVKRVFIIILSCLLLVLAITFIKIHLTNVDNLRITNEIKEVKKDNKHIDNEITEVENEIISLKDENKTKWQELSVWRNTKKKIEAALSQ